MDQIAAESDQGMVRISHWGFAVCRWTVAVALWLAWYFGSAPLTAACSAVLIINAIVGIRHAPLLLLGTLSLGRLLAPRDAAVDAQAMRFAHLLGGALLALSATLLYLQPQAPAGRVLLLWIALFKTAGALGYCGATQFFHCVLTGGTCCGFLRRKG